MRAIRLDEIRERERFAIDGVAREQKRLGAIAEQALDGAVKIGGRRKAPAFAGGLNKAATAFAFGNEKQSRGGAALGDIVADPAKRFKVEALQREVREIQIAVIEEIGTPLGISAGFNALDGD